MLNEWPGPISGTLVYTAWPAFTAKDELSVTAVDIQVVLLALVMGLVVAILVLALVVLFGHERS